VVTVALQVGKEGTRDTKLSGRWRVKEIMRAINKATRGDGRCTMAFMSQSWSGLKTAKRRRSRLAAEVEVYEEGW